MQTPFVYMILGFPESSPGGLLVIGALSLIALSVFLRIKLG